MKSLAKDNFVTAKVNTSNYGSKVTNDTWNQMLKVNNASKEISEKKRHKCKLHIQMRQWIEYDAFGDQV